MLSCSQQKHTTLVCFDVDILYRLNNAIQTYDLMLNNQLENLSVPLLKCCHLPSIGLMYY